MSNAEDLAREAMPEIELLRAEMAARKRSCTCPYWVTTDAVMPSPTCPTHGVDTSDRQILLIRATEALRALLVASEDHPADEEVWYHARSVLQDLDTPRPRQPAFQCS